MATSKIFEVKAVVGCADESITTKAIQTKVINVFSKGNKAKVLEAVVSPVDYKDPVVKYLLDMTKYRVFNISFYVWCKTDTFADGENISNKTFEPKIKTNIEGFLKNYEGESMNLNVFSVKCTN